MEDNSCNWRSILRTISSSVTCTPQLEKFTEALLKAQKEFKAVDRSKTGTAGGNHKYNYSSHGDMIDASREALHKYDLLVEHPVITDADGSYYVCIWIRHISGQGKFERIKFIPKDPTNCKDIGSSITYLKRYLYKSSLGMVDEEDGESEFENPSSKSTFKPVENKVENPPAIKKIWAIYFKLSEEKREQFLDLMESNCQTRQINMLNPKYFDVMIQVIEKLQNQ
jgi:hypothetical protein